MNIKILLIGMIAGLLVLGYGFYRSKQNEITPIMDPGGQWVLPTITPTPTPKTVYSAVLLGSGGAGHDGGELTDSIVIARVDTAAKITTLITVPRDLYVTFQKKDSEATMAGKINYVFYAGGSQTLKQLLETITGVNVDYFVSVDFSGFTKLVDLVGPLQVQVPTSFIDEWYPISGKETDSCGKSDTEIAQVMATTSGELRERQFPCRYERLEFTKGLVSMNGETVLKFVRSRHAPNGGGDFARSARQQSVLDAVKKQVLSVWTIPKLPTLVKTAKGLYTTDVAFESFWPLLSSIPDIGQFQTRRVVLSTDNVLMESISPERQYILAPKTGIQDWSSVREYVAGQL